MSELSNIPTKTNKRALLRAHEWARGQLVSLLDIRGLGRKRGVRVEANNRLKQLIDAGITTVDELLATDVKSLATRLAGCPGFTQSISPIESLLESWQADARLKIAAARAN